MKSNRREESVKSLLFVFARAPRARSLFVGFAAMYIKFDSGVSVAGVQGFVWLFVWWMLLALQMTYGKWMTEKIEMTQWERVFYTNAFALPPTAVLFFAMGENNKVSGLEMGHGAWFWLAASCAMGGGGPIVHRSVAHRPFTRGRGAFVFFSLNLRLGSDGRKRVRAFSLVVNVNGLKTRRVKARVIVAV